MIRLCQFTNRLSRGGVEERVARVMAGMDRSEFELAWMAFDLTGPSLDEKADLERRLPGLHVATFPREKTKIDLTALRQIAAGMRAWRPDVVHVHNWSTSLYGIAGARVAGAKKVIFGSGGRDSIDLPSSRQSAAMHALAPHVDHFTTVCRFLADEMSTSWGVPREAVSVLKTGVDVEAIRALVDRAALKKRFGIPDDAIVVGTIGMKRPVKRIEDVIDAVAKVGRSNPRVHLLWIGGDKDDTAPQEFIDRATDGGIAGRFHMPGRIEGEPTLVKVFDVFINASLFEGCSNAILEAMAAGVPVVATSVGGTPELIEDGRTGMLVPPLEPGAIARAVETLIERPHLRRQISHDASAFIDANHRRESMIAAYIEMYRSVASAPARTNAGPVSASLLGVVRAVRQSMAKQ